MKSNNYCVIMAGGIGSRFWPWSREEKPKQFLDILGTGKSLIQLTYDRFRKICPAENILVVTNERYDALIKEQLPELPKSNVLFEPVRRNTAPCVAYASYWILKQNPKANIVVTPADHLITNEGEFVRIIERGLKAVNSSHQLVTIGIKPHRPDTGYGYINYDKNSENEELFTVKEFTEKPDFEKAKIFIESGDYLWNAGIFIWSVNSICEQLSTHLPKLSNTFDENIHLLNTSEEKSFIHNVFPSFEDISIDYGIMEKAENVSVIPGDFGWSDLGTWGSLHEQIDKDGNNNGLFNAKALIENSSSNIVKIPKGKQLVLEGLDNFIIVDTGDTLLICPQSEEQKIKSFVAKL